MNSSQVTKVFAVALVASAVSCFNTDEDKSGSGGSGSENSSVMALTEVTNGFGRILPYLIPIADPVWATE